MKINHLWNPATFDNSPWSKVSTILTVAPSYMKRGARIAELSATIDITSALQLPEGDCGRIYTRTIFDGSAAL